jgi:hypothetical protein
VLERAVEERRWDEVAGLSLDVVAYGKRPHTSTRGQRRRERRGLYQGKAVTEKAVTRPPSPDTDKHKACYVKRAFIPPSLSR